MLYIPSMTQAIFGGSAGMAENIAGFIGRIAATAAIAGGG
jgi:type IV secretion system protein VirB6